MRRKIKLLLLLTCFPLLAFSEEIDIAEIQNQITSELNEIVQNSGVSNIYQIEPMVVIEGHQFDQNQGLWFVGCAIYTLLNGDSDSRFVYGVVAAAPDSQALVTDIVGEWHAVFYPLVECLRGTNSEIRINNTSYYFGPMSVRGTPPDQFLDDKTENVSAKIADAVNEYVQKATVARNGESNELSNIGSMNLLFLINEEGVVVDGEFRWNGQIHSWLRTPINNMGWNGSSTGYVVKVFFLTNRSVIPTEQ